LFAEQDAHHQRGNRRKETHMKNTRNLTRRFNIVNAATSNSLLDLVKRYEEAAEDQQVASTIAEQIDAVYDQLTDLEFIVNRTAKQEAKIKSLTKKVEALEKKLEAAESDCEMSAKSVEYYLNHMRDQMNRHIDNLEWRFNDCK
jgi:predicted RNase H-like nuclease (RuvC/YqgF family)